MSLPQRPSQHILEELSRRYFERSLPQNWTTTRPNSDYGVDLIVHIFNGQDATGHELQVQLKASQHSEVGEHEQIGLKVATYNYLKNHTQIALLVKYVADLDEAYYCLLAAVPPPNQGQQTFTVNIPKAQVLSTIDWAAKAALIERIVDYKLTAGQEIQDYLLRHGHI